MTKSTIQQTDRQTDKHIDGNTDNKGRKKKIFSTKSTTQHIDGNTDKGRTNFKIYIYIFFFDWIDYPTQTSTEILIIRVERNKKIPNFFSTTQHIDGNTDNKGRINFKIFFFNFFFRLDRLPNTNIDGNTDNKGRKKKKIRIFFFDNPIEPDAMGTFDGD